MGSNLGKSIAGFSRLHHLILDGLKLEQLLQLAQLERIFPVIHNLTLLGDVGYNHWRVNNYLAALESVGHVCWGASQLDLGLSPLRSIESGTDESQILTHRVPICDQLGEADLARG